MKWLSEKNLYIIEVSRAHKLKKVSSLKCQLSALFLFDALKNEPVNDELLVTVLNEGEL